MRTPYFAGLALSFCVLANGSIVAHAAAAGSRTYADPGPLAVEVKTLDASTSVVVPIASSGTPAAVPLIVASHGWSASGTNQLGWAKHFASYGFVVAVPTFPSPLSPVTATNAGIIEGLVAKLTGPLAATYGVSPGAFGLEGHSAGGLATTVAAIKLSPAATVLFDPVDKNGDGKMAYASLCHPVLAVFAESGACNQNAEWSAFQASTKADLVAFKVAGSTHCDGENAKRTLCGPFCGGGADPGRQAVYAHYTTAYFLSKLKADGAATAAIADAVIMTDSDLVGAAHTASTCTAHVTETDAGARDGSPNTSGGDAAATKVDAGNTKSNEDGVATAPSNVAPAANGDSGSTGCALIATANGAESVSFVAFAIIALSAARRRTRARARN